MNVATDLWPDQPSLAGCFIFSHTTRDLNVNFGFCGVGNVVLCLSVIPVDFAGDTNIGFWPKCQLQLQQGGHRFLRMPE